MTLQRARPLVSGPLTVGALCCMLGMAAAWALRGYTWDDSAITLGYARTLALDGEIRFGKYGPVVEGFSSPLWMFVGAALAKLDPRPASLLAHTQLTCALLYFLNAWLLDQLARRSSLSTRSRGVLLALYALSAVSVTSIADGMENHAFLALHLLAALAWFRFLDRSSAVSGGWLGGALAGLLWCRPEGVLSVGVFAVALMWLAYQKGRSVAGGLSCCLGLALVGLATLLAWRWQTFEALGPNTIDAKQWPPYSAGARSKLLGSLLQIAHVVAASLVPLLPVMALVASRRQLRSGALASLGRAARQHLVLLGCIAVQVGFFFLTGRVWGTDNRTALAILPYIWLVLLLAAQDLQWQELSPPRIATAIVASMALFLVVQAHYLRKYVANVATVAFVYRRTAPAVQLARMVTSRRWRIATPDVGAALLWWGQEVELVDTALLNEPRSAREGWQALPHVLFDDHPPDALLVHNLWTEHSGLDRSVFVRERYAKVAINGELCILLRRESVEELRALIPTGSWSTPAGRGMRDETKIPIPILANLELKPLAFP